MPPRRPTRRFRRPCPPAFSSFSTFAKACAKPRRKWSSLSEHHRKKSSTEFCLGLCLLFLFFTSPFLFFLFSEALVCRTRFLPFCWLIGFLCCQIPVVNSFTRSTVQVLSSTTEFFIPVLYICSCR